MAGHDNPPQWLAKGGNAPSNSPPLATETSLPPTWSGERMAGCRLEPPWCARGQVDAVGDVGDSRRRRPAAHTRNLKPQGRQVSKDAQNRRCSSPTGPRSVPGELRSPRTSSCEPWRQPAQGTSPAPAQCCGLMWRRARRSVRSVLASIRVRGWPRMWPRCISVAGRARVGGGQS